MELGIYKQKQNYLKYKKCAVIALLYNKKWFVSIEDVIAVFTKSSNQRNNRCVLKIKA
jgi:hypothetical protein